MLGPLAAALNDKVSRDCVVQREVKYPTHPRSCMVWLRVMERVLLRSLSLIRIVFRRIPQRNRQLLNAWDSSVIHGYCSALSAEVLARVAHACT
jgi:hypothetical protein